MIVQGVTLTAEQEEDLERCRAASRELAGAVASPWEPPCIARAWARKAPFTVPPEQQGRFTMQVWIDLDHLRSALLVNDLPATLEELAASAACFGLAIEEMPVRERMDVATGLLRRINDAFALQLDMKPPGRGSRDRGGFGQWAPLLACLTTQAGLDLDRALAFDVGQAFIFLASMRFNEGWSVAGVAYADRESEMAGEEAE